MPSFVMLYYIFLSHFSYVCPFFSVHKQLEKALSPVKEILSPRYSQPENWGKY